MKIQVKIRDYLWLALSLLLFGILFTQIAPSQRLVTQCLDEIWDYEICELYERNRWRECCVIYPGNNVRVAYCYVDVYRQLRPYPLPPSYYFTNRRQCGYPTSEACTPMIKLHCPTP